MKKLFLLMALSIFAIGQMWGASHTYQVGDKIYIDTRSYSGKIRVPKTDNVGYVGSGDKKDGGEIFTIEFNKSGGLKYSDGNDFIKTEPTGGGSYYLKYSVPGEGQNCVLVAADGQSFSWTTYNPDGPNVSFSGLPDAYYRGQNVTFAAISDNVDNPTYTYYVKQGSGSYGSAVTNYTFNDLGSYTIKVEVRENGAGDVLAYAEQAISVGYLIAAGTTIYFDGHLFSGQIRYPKTDANEPGSKVNIEELKAITFPNDRVWYTNEIFVKPYPGGSGQDLAFKAPEPGQNCVIIAASGTEYSWSTYSQDQPSVAISGLSSTLVQGQNVVFAATSENVENPVYAFYVKQGEGEYGEAVANYTFDAVGSYTVKVEVRANGTGDALAYAEQAISVGYLIAAGTTIYFDGHLFSGQIRYPKTDANEPGSKVNIEELKAITFPNDRVWYTNEIFVKPYPGGSGQDLAFKAPEPGQNCVIIAASGTEYSWSTYSQDQPSVAISGLSSTLVQGQNVVFAATSENVTNPAYTFYVKPQGGEYGAAVANYTFADAGSYTVKVEVREEGATGDALATATKNVTVEEGHIFTAGTTIYIDCRNLVGKIKIPKNNQKGYENDQRDGGTIYEVTFTADVTWKPSDTFIKPKPTGGSETSVKFIVPVGNQNCVIVPAAGNSFTWGYYNPNEPNVAFNSTFPAEIGVGGELEFLASYVTSEHVTNPAYKFYVKPEGGEYGAAVAKYTFADAGSYTMKVEVREQGATGDALAYAEQAIGCTNSYTVYFNNTLGWSKVYIHLYTDDKSLGTNGIGGTQATVQDEMTQIGESEFFEYTYSAVNPFTKVCFTKIAQYNYNDFSGENVSTWSGQGYDVANNKVLWTPDATQYTPINGRSYYNVGQWSAYPPSAADVVFDNLPEEVLYGNAVTFAAIASNIEEPVTFKYYVKLSSEAAYGEAIEGNEYSFPAAGTYNVKVEAYAPGATDAAATAEASIRCAKYELMMNNRDVKGTSVAECTTNDGTTFVAYWTCPAAGTYYFYMTKDAASNANKNCDYLNENQTLSDGGSGKTAYLYGTSKYDHSYKLVAPRPGVYTFTLTLGSTIKFKCNFPSEQEVIVYEIAADYATMYADKPLMVPADMEAYYVSGIDGSGNLTMVELEKIPANTGVILHAMSPSYDAEGKASYMFYECEAQEAIDGNMLKGTIDDEVIDNQHVHYIMTLSNNVPGLYWPYGTAAGVGAFENKAGKAYLEVPVDTPVPAQVSARRGFPFSYRTPTAIENIETQAENAKLIRNGQLLIIREGKIYNAQGARVQ